MELPVAKADEAFGPDGGLLDEQLNEQLERILTELVSQVRVQEAVAA